MEKLEIILPSSKQLISVSVDRKNMKTCRLKIYTDQTVVISVPSSVPKEWIQIFLEQKANWIEKKLERFAATIGYASTNEIRNGYERVSKYYYSRI